MNRIHGFTLIEILLAIAILGIVATIAVPSYSEYIDRARNADAMADISSMEAAIERFYITNQRYPVALAEIAYGAAKDPWKQAYFYNNLQLGLGGAPRADGSNNPINTDYDLYSKGKDTVSITSLADPKSYDDIIRGRNGRFIGLAKDY